MSSQWKLLTNQQELINLHTGQHTYVPRYQIVADDRAICSTASSATRADASLIAAAPEMLEALQGLMSVCAQFRALHGLNPAQKELMNAAFAVIAKARGDA